MYDILDKKFVFLEGYDGSFFDKLDDIVVTYSMDSLGVGRFAPVVLFYNLLNKTVARTRGNEPRILQDENGLLFAANTYKDQKQIIKLFGDSDS